MATFVGNANILKGVAGATENGKVAVNISGGHIQADSHNEIIRPGEKVTLAVRSENIRIDEECSCGLSAVVTEKTFAGGTSSGCSEAYRRDRACGKPLWHRRQSAAGADSQRVLCAGGCGSCRPGCCPGKQGRPEDERNKSKKENYLSVDDPASVFFTLVFVAGPLIYMVALSFAQPGSGTSVEWNLTLENYRKILDPVYLQTFRESFQLALTSTVIICLVGYPFGYFMAKMSDTWKKRAMLLLMLPFWINSLIRLYGWIIILQNKGVLNYILKGLGIIDKPLKILYSYPAIVVGMVYVLLPFMILSVYSSAEKLDWSLVEAARDLGAGKIKAFWTVSFKLTLPGLLSGVILTFIPSMGLFFIADILGGNKIVLVGSLIQEQMTRGNNWPFAAALAVVLMILTSLMIGLYRKMTGI